MSRDEDSGEEPLLYQQLCYYPGHESGRPVLPASGPVSFKHGSFAAMATTQPEARARRPGTGPGHCDRLRSSGSLAPAGGQSEPALRLTTG
jgi:hypothetical protein